MSTTEYDRWYIVPTVTVTEQSGQSMRVAKYRDLVGIAGWSGTVIHESLVDDNYPSLIQIYPDQTYWYIVRMYGLGNDGWSALNQISIVQDARTLATHATDVVPVLETHFPGLSKTPDEWAATFSVEL